MHSMYDMADEKLRWQMKNVPHQCKCGRAFSRDHVMTCPYGRLPLARHNEIRDITILRLTEVCTHVEKEPQLQSLSGEIIQPNTANKQDDARFDIRAKGFWSRQQDVFFYVRVVHPNASSYQTTIIPALYRQHEMAKKREYGDNIREVERVVFTPLFPTMGGMGREPTVGYKRLAELLAQKRKSDNDPVLLLRGCDAPYHLPLYN